MSGATDQIVLESLQRLESKLDKMDCRLQELEKADVNNDNVADKVKDHESRIRNLEKLAQAMQAVIWIAGGLGLSIIALIWALITGQAFLTFVK